MWHGGSTVSLSFQHPAILTSRLNWAKMDTCWLLKCPLKTAEQEPTCADPDSQTTRSSSRTAKAANSALPGCQARLTTREPPPGPSVGNINDDLGEKHCSPKQPASSQFPTNTVGENKTFSGSYYYKYFWLEYSVRKDAFLQELQTGCCCLLLCEHV